MDENDGRFTALYCTDGWFEIREDGNPEGWIATDAAVWIPT
ncbi:hypothetical protein [Halegenticoccus soli]|nr:hypothetical protein [Halegenticoccus soli]